MKGQIVCRSDPNQPEAPMNVDRKAKEKERKAKAEEKRLRKLERRNAKREQQSEASKK